MIKEQRIEGLEGLERPIPATATEQIEPAAPPSKRMNPLVIFITMGLALVVLFAFGMALLKANLTQLQDGMAPDFTIKTYSSSVPQFTLSQFRGRVVVINFWASWCDSCKDEVLDLNAVWDEYKARDVAFIGVGHVDTTDKALGFIKTYNIQYLTGPDNGTMVYDSFRVGGLPETYVVDKKGNLAKTFIGAVTANDLRAVLDNLLAQS